MVKEVDRGEIGDDRIAFVPLTPGAARPLCATRAAARERVVSAKDWSGYLAGLKGGYVFIQSGDGANNALGVAVFDPATARKLFTDDITGTIEFPPADGSALHLRYERAFSAKCALPAKGAACWTEILAATHLAQTPMPDCLQPYADAARDMAQSRCEDEKGDKAACVAAQIAKTKSEYTDDPSVIGYSVDVVIDGARTSVTPAGTPPRCWPAD